MAADNENYKHSKNLLACWDFTIFDDWNSECTLEKLSTFCDRGVFQEEECPSTGKLHYQGRVHLKQRKKYSVAVNAFFKAGFEGFRISPTCSHNRHNAFYVTKEETRIDGPWVFGDEPDDEEKGKPFVADWELAMPAEKYPWQTSVMGMMGARIHDWRTIHVVVDPVGNMGKSTLINMCEVNKLGYLMPLFNTYEKMCQFTCSFFTTLKLRSPRNLCYDFPRGFRDENVGNVISALETIKSGRLFDGRYKATVWKYNIPNIWLFMNEAPSVEFLTRDRWKIWRISADKKLYSADSGVQNYFPIGPTDICESLGK